MDSKQMITTRAVWWANLCIEAISSWNRAWLPSLFTPIPTRPTLQYSSPNLMTYVRTKKWIFIISLTAQPSFFSVSNVISICHFVVQLQKLRWKYFLKEVFQYWLCCEKFTRHAPPFEWSASNWCSQYCCVPTFFGHSSLGQHWRIWQCG